MAVGGKGVDMQVRTRMRVQTEWVRGKRRSGEGVGGRGGGQ